MLLPSPTGLRVIKLKVKSQKSKVIKARMLTITEVLLLTSYLLLITYEAKLIYVPPNSSFKASSLSSEILATRVIKREISPGYISATVRWEETITLPS